MVDEAHNIKLCAIVAMAENRVIGGNNKLLWHIPEDLKHFKRTTMGKPLIMGRKTFESLPGILPGRPHIVISRSGGAISKNNRVTFVSSIEQGIEIAREMAAAEGQDEIFITGGGKIYRQTLLDVERLYLTIVHKNFEGDTTFPEFDWDAWDVHTEEEHEKTDKHPAFTVYILDRK